MSSDCDDKNTRNVFLEWTDDGLARNVAFENLERAIVHTDKALYSLLISNPQFIEAAVSQ